MIPPVIILINPQMGENIGAAARGMKNFSLSDLRIVAPRDGWPNPKATEMAAGAADILERAALFDTTAQAVADRQRVYATTARDRHVNKDVVTVRELFVRHCEEPCSAKNRWISIDSSSASDAAIHRTADTNGDVDCRGHIRPRNDEGMKTAILFGPERTGLTNEDIALADAILTIPVDPAYPSLNLSQAVNIVGYEYYLSRHSRESGNLEVMSGLKDSRFRVNDEKPAATKSELQSLFDHLKTELDAGDFWKVPEKEAIMWRNIRATIQRASLTGQDIRTLHGIIRCLACSRNTDD